MVGNILALSRLEADAWQPQCENVPLSEVIGAALDTFDAPANARIIVNLASPLCEAWLDMVQIVQVLHNLLENALKYSPADSLVEVSAKQDNNHLVIEVADRGVGLPPGEEGHIFDQFYRAPRWRESASPGAGIGLAICRGLVEAHGGQITAANRSGGGAVFGFTLPRHPANLTHSPHHERLSN
jgi:two-component system sensor histidine kinase KdpD